MKISVHVDGLNLYHALDRLSTKHKSEKDYTRLNIVKLINFYFPIENITSEKFFFYTSYPQHKSLKIQEKHLSYIKEL